MEKRRASSSKTRVKRVPESEVTSIRLPSPVRERFAAWCTFAGRRKRDMIGRLIEWFLDLDQPTQDFLLSPDAQRSKPQAAARVLINQLRYRKLDLDPQSRAELLAALEPGQSV